MEMVPLRRKIARMGIRWNSGIWISRLKNLIFSEKYCSDEVHTLRIGGERAWSILGEYEHRTPSFTFIFIQITSKFGLDDFDRFILKNLVFDEKYCSDGFHTLRGGGRAWSILGEYEHHTTSITPEIKKTIGFS